MSQDGEDVSCERATPTATSGCSSAPSSVTPGTVKSMMEIFGKGPPVPPPPRRRGYVPSQLAHVPGASAPNPNSIEGLRHDIDALRRDVLNLQQTTAADFEMVRAALARIQDRLGDPRHSPSRQSSRVSSSKRSRLARNRASGVSSESSGESDSNTNEDGTGADQNTTVVAAATAVGVNDEDSDAGGVAVPRPPKKVVVVMGEDNNDEEESLHNNVALRTGFLLRKSESSNNKWTRRWFILTPLYLRHYKKIGDDYNNPVGTIELAHATQVRAVLSASKKPNVFEVTTSSHAVRMAADTADDMQAWVSAIAGVLSHFRQQQQQPTRNEKTVSVVSSFSGGSDTLSAIYPSGRAVSQMTTRTVPSDVECGDSSSMASSKSNVGTSSKSSLPLAPLRGAAAMTGWLTKQGGSHRTWKRRWFVLGRGGNADTLLYFRDEKETQMMGGIQLAECPSADSVRLGTAGSDPNAPLPDSKCPFHVCTPSRTYNIVAETRQQAYMWVEAIRSILRVLEEENRLGGIDEEFEMGHDRDDDDDDDDDDDVEVEGAARGEQSANGHVGGDTPQGVLGLPPASPSSSSAVFDAGGGGVVGSERVRYGLEQVNEDDTDDVVNATAAAAAAASAVEESRRERSESASAHSREAQVQRESVLTVVGSPRASMNTMMENAVLTSEELALLNGPVEARFAACGQSGYMRKKGGGTSVAGSKAWKRRWFVLRNSPIPKAVLMSLYKREMTKTQLNDGLGILMYFKSDAEKELLGCVDMGEAVSVELVDHHTYAWALSIATPDRTYVLATDTKEEMDAWYKKLQICLHIVSIHRADVNK